MSHLFPQNAPGFGWDHPPPGLPQWGFFLKMELCHRWVCRARKRPLGICWKHDVPKRKKEQQDSFNFERSRGSEDIGSTIPKKILCSVVNDPKGMRFFDFRKDLLSLGILKNPSCHWPCALAPLKEMRKAGWFDVFSGTAERHGTIQLSSNIDLEKFQQISRCEFCSIWPQLPSRSCLFGR